MKIAKTLAALLVFSILLGLSACGNAVGVTIENQLTVDVTSMDAAPGADNIATVHISDYVAHGDSCVVTLKDICGSRNGVIDLTVVDADTDTYVFNDLDLRNGDTVVLLWSDGIAQARVTSGNSTTIYEAQFLIGSGAYAIQNFNTDDLSYYLGYWAYDDGVSIGILENDTWTHYGPDGVLTGTSHYVFDGTAISLYGAEDELVQSLISNGDYTLLDADGALLYRLDREPGSQSTVQ